MNKITKTKIYQQVLIWILSLTFIFSLLNVRSRGRGGVRLRSLTEQTHIKIRVKIPESLSATNKHQQSLVSIVKQFGSEGVKKQE